MKQKYLDRSGMLRIVFAVLLFSSQWGLGQIFSDNASNYGGSWSNNSNEGTGFGSWTLSPGDNLGGFIGTPANNGMGTSGIGTTAFGMFSTGTGYFNAYRSINNGIQIGDIFSFYWAINWDANTGSKGFDLRSGSITIFNVNNGGNSTITTSNGIANTNYGTEPMLVTVTRTSASQYSFTMTSRSGDATYSTTINSSETIDGFNIYIGNQQNGDSNRNMYVNAFSITKPITIANGNWDSSSTWLNNNIPPAGASITIDHNVTVNTNISLRSIVINSGKSLSASDATPRTITILNGGTLTNNGTFTAGTGTIAFSGSGTVSGTVGFNNVNIAGGVNFGTASTINGTLTINNGGFVDNNAPFYASASTLRYNDGLAYGRSTEWSATSGRGYPHHVQISNNTTLNLNNSTNIARQIAGNLTIDSGSTLSMENMSNGSFEIGLQVLGDILNSGNLSFSTTTERIRCTNFTNNSGATTTLSSNIGGDLEITGNLTKNGTFNSNNRAVFFTGSGVQQIDSSNSLIIDYIFSNKSSGSIQLQKNLLCEGPNGGNAITLTNASDIIDLNGFTATFGKSGIFSVITGNGFIKGGATSSLNLLGTGNFGNIRMDQTIPGTTNLIENFTLNRTASGSATIANTMVLKNTLTLTSGNLTSNGNLVLASDANNTARVAPVGVGTGVTGNVTVERFIPAKRAWRLLTAPLTNATNATIQTHWQNTGTGTGLLLWNPNQVAGMQTGQGIANIYRFGSPSAGWNAINNTTTEPLFGNEVNHAFLVFATAPANETNVTASAQATTLRPTGSLRVGDVAYTNLPANTYRLLGNPYASALDIGLLKSQNPAAFGTLWFLDPNLGDFGGYVTYNGSAFAPSANTNPAHTYSTTNTRIESGQAFFVRPSAEATFTFTESQKASNVSYSMAKPATSSTNSLNGIRANLYKTVNQNPIITDGILAIFDANETNEVNGNDSRKFTNNNENIMFRNSNISISIENRALPLAQDELLIRLTNTGANQNYQLRLFTENYTNSLIQPYLQDALTQQLTAIPIDGSELIYPFNGITSSNASPDERFKIVFQNNPLGFDNNQLGSIAVFPNPINDGYFDIQLPYLVNETLNYAIYNMQGQLIIPENDLAPAVINHRIQTSGLAKGVYLLKVKGANQEWNQKIIVN